MSVGDRERWDERHASSGAVDVRPPDGLDESIDARVSGRALDVACGRGGQSVWAALRGLAVVALDVSPVAVEATSQLAVDHGVDDRVDARVVDLDDGLPSGLGSFDLVICQRYRQPDLIGPLADALVPGGVLVASVLSLVGADAPGRFHAPAGELEGVVRSAGLTIERSVEADGVALVVARR